MPVLNINATETRRGPARDRRHVVLGSVNVPVGTPRLKNRPVKAGMHGRRDHAASANRGMRWQSLVEQLPVAVAVLDRNLRYLAVSHRFLVDHRLADGSLIGRHHPTVFPHHTAQWTARLARGVAGASERVDAEPFVCADGQTHLVRWDITSWYTEAHEIGGILLCSEVVTQQARVLEQLRQAQKTQTLGHLAGGVAHDFNNLLMAIFGYSELLTRQIGPDKPMGQDLRHLMAAAQRAATLTRQLLAFSRKPVRQMVAVDLSSVVRDVEPMFRRLIGEQIALHTALAADLAPVMADAAQLEQVLMNLVVNARDAMPQGGVLTITTGQVELDSDDERTHPGAKAGLYAMVSVADTGMGMPPDIQARVFEPFFTTKEREQGTGLGLAVVDGIVTQLGGSIGIESAVGRGTTIQVYLPIVTQAAASPTTLVPTASPVGRETILLVEDNDNARAFVKTVLERFGYRVLEANGAEAALALLERQNVSIHLLVTDVVLPGLDGCELAARVRLTWPRVPVLYMSGYLGRGRTADGMREIGAHVLEKPFTAHALLSRTRELLDGGPLDASGPA